MEKDESGLGSAVKLEIDDEGNLGHPNDGAVNFWSSSCSSSSCGDCSGEVPAPGPYQTTWPQSYRCRCYGINLKIKQPVSPG